MRVPVTVLAGLVFSLFAGLTAQPATALTVTLWSAYPGTLVAAANDGVGASASQTVIPTSPPYGFTSSVTDGAVSSTAQYTLSNSSFDIVLTQTRSTDPSAGSYADGNIYFTVDQNATYQASGSFNVLDPVGRATQYLSSLYDLTSSAYLYYSNQDSRLTPNESFTLGGLGGDFANQFNGSLNGTLIAGQIYQLYYTASLSNQSTTTAVATAAGDLHLALVPIPEPGTALLTWLGIVGLSLCGRSARRRRVIVASLLLFFGSSASASAATIYTYVGNPYLYAYTSSPYTTAMSLAGTFTLSSAVAANQTNIDILGSLGNFTIFDGVNVYDQTSPAYFSEFRVSTDSVGNISEWALEFDFLNGSEVRSCNAGSIVAAGVCTGLVQDYTYDAPYNSGAANLSTAGTFSVVPEPATALLLGLGLIGLARCRRDRGRAPARA